MRFGRKPKLYTVYIDAYHTIKKMEYFVDVNTDADTCTHLYISILSLCVRPLIYTI